MDRDLVFPNDLGIDIYDARLGYAQSDHSGQPPSSVRQYTRGLRIALEFNDVLVSVVRGHELSLRAAAEATNVLNCLDVHCEIPFCGGHAELGTDQRRDHVLRGGPRTEFLRLALYSPRCFHRACKFHCRCFENQGTPSCQCKQDPCSSSRPFSCHPTTQCACGLPNTRGCLCGGTRRRFPRASRTPSCLEFAVPVLPTLGTGDRKLRDDRALRAVLQLRISAEIADYQDFLHGGLLN